PGPHDRQFLLLTRAYQRVASGLLHAMEAKIIGPPLQQGDAGFAFQSGPDTRQVDVEKLVLQRAGGGRQDGAHAGHQGWHEISEGFAGTGAGFTDEMTMGLDSDRHTIGHAGHAEVEGTLGQIDGTVHLVGSVGDVAALKVNAGAKLAYVTQTTLSVDDTREIIAALQQRFPDIHGPGLYFHVGLDECFVGGGIWRPEPRSLAQIRQRIVDKPKLWAGARKVAAQLPGGQFFGESLKRVPGGYAADHAFADDLRRKDFVIARTFEPGLLHSTEFLIPPIPPFLCGTLKQYRFKIAFI
ncbi:MAG: DUF2461 family protein, partial [Opitutaceae bacterium]|nr:DUF2461 family protein [Opitutaceae bacterium]